MKKISLASYVYPATYDHICTENSMKNNQAYPHLKHSFTHLSENVQTKRFAIIAKVEQYFIII